MDRIYIAIDLKSFYASAECVALGLDPLETNLVVADESRSDKTICLAVTPALKAYGIPGRLRLFEVNQKLAKINEERLKLAPKRRFYGKSANARVLDSHPELAVDYLVAMPRMAYYIKKSAEIYSIYLKYVSPDDMHVYSIDEVFIDATDYLKLYKKTPKEFATTIIADVFKTTGITATAGIGTNLYLAKVAMDIIAKHMPEDENGARIAQLDQMSYRQKLWTHRPLSDFWRIGRGYMNRLENARLYTMGDIARCSLGAGDRYHNQDLLYKLFGINAELLIDHAWGYEPCTMKDIKSYKPESNSVSSGQVLSSAYTYEKAQTVMMEMANELALDLFSKRLATNQISISIGYDKENIKNDFLGEIKKDYYGRAVPKHSQGNINLENYTSSLMILSEKTSSLFEKIANKNLLIRRLCITACNVLSEDSVPKDTIELDLFIDYEKEKAEKDQKEIDLKRERSMQRTLIDIKKRYGNNSILKGLDFKEGATAIERNTQIGGHKA